MDPRIFLFIGVVLIVGYTAWYLSSMADSNRRTAEALEAIHQMLIEARNKR